VHALLHACWSRALAPIFQARVRARVRARIRVRLRARVRRSP
jgi:hypothetical protein